MKKLILILSFIIYSCSNLDFVYDDNKEFINPLYEKTKINISGKDFTFLKSYIPTVFGVTKSDIYVLSITIEEKKTKRSVEKNQTTSNLDYELRFNYSLMLNEENCVVYEKVILSNFSIIPKSAGYNYGTDSSLETRYKASVKNNLDQFVSFLSSVDINNC